MSKIQSPAAIKRATASDLEKVSKLLTSCELTLAGIEDAELWFVRNEDVNKRLKGCVGLETRGKNGLLRSLAVRKEYRDSGTGSTLVRHVIQVAKERKLDNLFLLTLTAKDYFPRFGFILVTRATVEEKEITKSGEFEACSTTSILMRLQLK